MTFDKDILREVESLVLRWRAGTELEPTTRLVADLRRKYLHLANGGTLRNDEYESILARCIRVLERHSDGELYAAATAVIDELDPATDTQAVRRLRAVLGEL